ncbi:MAG: hypothetical protein ACK4RV_10420 [Caulobacter sp.]
MTEAEAKEKWCPFARIASPMSVTVHGQEQWIGVAGANRGANSERIALQGAKDPSNPESARCIGSACTAWRWSRASSQSPSSVRYPNDPGAGADAHGFWHRDGEPLGFCGLAGRPE